MRARELFRRYHQSIDELVQSAGPISGRQQRLRALLDQFDDEAATLETASAARLREELTEQLEQEALGAMTTDRREVLFAAVKRLELQD